MTHNLYQKDWFLNRKWFEITSDGLLLKSKRLTEESELFVKFDDIGLKVIKSKSGKRGWLIGAVIFLLLSIGLFVHERTGGDTDKNAFAVYLILSAICFIIFYFTFKRSFYLANNENRNAIEFLIDKPNKVVLDIFIESLKTERKNYLLKKYGQFSKLLSYENQYNHLQWLYDTSTLTEQEFELKHAELKSLFNPANPIIGFQAKRD